MKGSEHSPEGTRSQGLPPLSAVGWFVDCRMRDLSPAPPKADRMAEDTVPAEPGPPLRSCLARLCDHAFAAKPALGFLRVLGSRPAQGK